MNNTSVKQIKKTQFNLLQLILTTIFIASGVNILIMGIVSYFDNQSGLLFIIIGSILIILTTLITVLIDFKKSKVKTIINCVVCYNPEKRELVEVPYYSLSEDLT